MRNCLADVVVLRRVANGRVKALTKFLGMTPVGPRKKIVGVALDDYMDALVAKEVGEQQTTASTFFAHLAALYFDEPNHDPYRATAIRQRRKRNRNEDQGELPMAM